jgi:DNA polymerase-3 subunit epsilon/ATP-dependent DNA helicase DinG
MFEFMTPTFVALDLETTGLDPETDAITEIGAVRFRGDGEVVDTFQQLVNPGREIPLFVQQLTGVTNDAVATAPHITEIVPQLQAFAGEDAIVGHNIAFDLAYLRQAGFRQQGPVLDTGELSRVLMPDRQPRNLGELAKVLGAPPATLHRALADASTTAAVFAALLRRADALEPEERARLANFVAMRDEPLARVVGGETWGLDGSPVLSLPQVRKTTPPPPLARIEGARAVTEGEVDNAFEAASRVFDGFEHRAEQREMAAAVQEAFARGGHFMVEAGTGVGKSLAYLIPAALHALRHGERVVISTNTINLQGQLLGEDIPALRSILREAGAIRHDGELRVALLKGRGNYLCLNRFYASYTSKSDDPDFERLAASMLLWLPKTETGDRQELSVDHETWVTWQRFSAQDADCLQRQNRYVRDGDCFLLRARQAAESAHILIVNHALLLADLVAHGSAIPPFDHLIVDEAHNLEGVATQQLGMSATRRSIDDMLDGIYRTGGRDSREGGAACLLRGMAAPMPLRGKAIEQAVQHARSTVIPFCEALGVHVPARGEDDRALVTHGIRAQESWTAVELAWSSLDEALGAVSSAISSAAHAIAADAVENAEAFATEIETVKRKLDETRSGLATLMDSASDDTIVWVGRDRDGLGTINAAPLEVGPRLFDDLWSELRTVVATSATLSADGDMRYSADRLGFEQPESLQLGSPFDYASSTLLTSFTDLPDPGSKEYTAAAADAIVQLTLASQGRAMALFTSHAAVRATADLVRPPLEAAGIVVMAQGVDGHPGQLRDALKLNPRTLVLGTSSLWEGVDIRGEALSLLIIAKLPFAVPTDPVHRARSERYDNPFMQYALPAAILRFRQGFGRLIRDKSDRGVVAVLDSRIWSKRYGSSFANALPGCTRFRGRVSDVAAEAAAWLAP